VLLVSSPADLFVFSRIAGNRMGALVERGGNLGAIA
jgi:hypothetical protein